MLQSFRALRHSEALEVFQCKRNRSANTAGAVLTDENKSVVVDRNVYRPIPSVKTVDLKLGQRRWHREYWNANDITYLERAGSARTESPRSAAVAEVCLANCKLSGGQWLPCK